MKQELAPRGVGIPGLQAGEDVKCTEEVRPLGECEDFEHASERADALDPPWGCHWVFSEERLRLFKQNIEEVLN